MSNIEEGQGSGRRGERGLAGIMGASHELRGGGVGDTVGVSKGSCTVCVGQYHPCGQGGVLFSGYCG